MTIDERLEALVGRHEALTQSVELLLADTRAHAEQLRIDGEHIREHTGQLRIDGEHIRAVVRIAELHHERLEHLEDRLDR